MLKTSKIRQHEGCRNCGSDRLTAIADKDHAEVHCMQCGHVEDLYAGHPANTDDSFVHLSRQIEDEFREMNRMKSWIKR